LEAISYSTHQIFSMVWDFVVIYYNPRFIILYSNSMILRIIHLHSRLWIIWSWK
jgi:hypothetical protein